jgi:predicted alpha/beta hydrolase family esterase
LIGHSCGCAFLVRWLGETGIKIRKLILVAPWKIAPEQDKFRELFYNYQINNNVAAKVGEIIMFTSNNEAVEGKKSLQIFHNALGGKIITVKNMGHFTREDMGTEQLPELLKQVIAK